MANTNSKKTVTKKPNTAAKKPAPIIPIKPIFDPKLPITKTKPVAKVPAKPVNKPSTSKIPAKPVNKPGTGKPTPQPVAKSTTQKTVPNPRNTPPKAMSNKQVVKKDGKTVVTYDSKKTGAFGMATYPAKVTKVYDNKGNLIRGNRRVQGSYGSSAMERIYDPKKKPTAKPTPKPTPKPVAKTPVKTPVKPTPKPVSKEYGPRTKEVLNYMKPSNTLATKPKPITPTKPKPAAKTTPKPTATTPKPTPKPTTATKPAAKTVSELWAEKTGTSWSEAKKQGLSDGSAKSNMELMKKLQSGSVNKETIATMKDNSKVATLDAKDTKVTKSTSAATTPATTTTPEKPEAKPTAKQMAGSGMGAMERMEGMYKKGGSVKRKMKPKKK
jgi:hypothetical protein